ncbi:MAG: putative glycoside hydrolase, partial [Ruminococcus sp.]|nr:putative glycoside hydrolase [Ruminococcus sp.]
MKRKDKGRKIYKTKEKNYYDKSPMGKFMSTILTVLLIGGIGFIGYSVAGPMIDFSKHKGDEPIEPAVTESTEATESDETPATEPDTETTSGSETKSKISYTAAVIDEADMTDLKSLQSALEAIPKNKGIEYIEIPLKATGGAIYYASSVEKAEKAGAIKSALTLEQITESVKKSGFKSSAIVSTFNDNILPVKFPEVSYWTVSDNKIWLDKNQKSWTAPYSQDALDYISEIISEISSSGFDKVICSDFVYPEFSERDLTNLEERLSQSDRFMSLTSSANLFYDKLLSNGASMFIEVSAYDVLSGKAEILQPMLLSANNIILNIDLDEMGNGVSDEHTFYEFKGSSTEKINKCLG